MRKLIMLLSLVVVYCIAVPAYAQRYAPTSEDSPRYGYTQQSGYGHPEYVPQAQGTSGDDCVRGRCSSSKGPKGTYTTPPRRTARGYVTQSGKESFLHDDLTGLVYEPDKTEADVARLEWARYYEETSWEGCGDPEPNPRAKNIKRKKIREGGFNDQIYGDHPTPPAVVTGGSSEGMVKGFVKAIPNALVGAFSGGTNIAVGAVANGGKAIAKGGKGGNSNAEINNSGNSSSSSSSSAAAAAAAAAAASGGGGKHKK